MHPFLKYPKLFFAILAALFFLPFLGGVHLFDWDEVNFAEIAKEMILMDNYLQIHVNFLPFTEKPPGFFWLQVISMKLFGIGEYAARFPNAVFGIITLPVLYAIGNKIKGKQFGIFWSLAYFGSILPNLYFKSGIIDPVFNFFMFLGMVYLIFFIWKKDIHKSIHLPQKAPFYLIMAGIFTGCAILVKGPVAFLITILLLIVYWASNRFKLYIKPLEFILYTIITLTITGIWYGVEYYINGSTFIQEFIIRQWTIFSTQDAGHGGFPGYHFIVLFFGCFPTTAFAIYAMTKLDTSDPVSTDFKKWMTYLFWVVLILFTVVQSKIVHYSSMAYFPITYLGAVCIHKLYTGIWKFSRLKKVLLWIGFIPIFLAPIFIFSVGRFPELGKKMLAKDPFAVANLDADVNWVGWELFSSVLILVVFLYALKYFKNNRNWKGAWILYIGTAAWIFLTLVGFIGKIEKYSQGANIEFWESKKSEDCYLFNYKYSTYTKLFYGIETPNKTVANHLGTPYLIGDLDKPVYFSCKINREKDLLREAKDPELLYRKNGFCFYIRRPTLKK